MRSLLIAALIILSTWGGAASQPKSCTRIAFWHLENLYDTINNPGVADNEFTPTGRQTWNTEKYIKKTTQIRQTITRLNPAIMGICEVENGEVIHDILPRSYRYVHYDSPDIRGIDVALIYDPSRVQIIASEPIRAYGKLRTRDLLRVDAVVDSLAVTLVVAHLPSRRGNNPAATAQRLLIGHQLDSLSTIAPLTIIMGDMNQNPSKGLVPKLHNTTTEAQRQGQGTYAYRDTWQMYDQIIVSKPLTTNAKIYTQNLIQTTGRFRGYPARGNPSDHLPIYIELESEK